MEARVTNPIPSTRKNHKQQTRNESNSNRNNIQHLLSFMPWLWIQTPHHILIPQSHGHEHEHRQKSMHHIHGIHPILAQIRQACGSRVGIIKQPQPLPSHKTIVNLAVGALDAVGEGGQEAGSSKDDEEHEGHGARGSVT